MQGHKSEKENILVSTALTIASKNVNSACWFWLYQPEIPAKVAEKLKK